FPNSKFIVISLGTGRYLTPLEKYSNAGVAQWVSPLITLLMDSEQLNHHDTMEMLAEFDGSKYYRIQPTLEEELNLADASDEDVKKLIAVGDKVINDSTNQLDEIAEMLSSQKVQHLIDFVKKHSKLKNFEATQRKLEKILDDGLENLQIVC
ncbi:23654_t:CDS:2, partial [Gigaspora rosea]